MIVLVAKAEASALLATVVVFANRPVREKAALPLIPATHRRRTLRAKVAVKAVSNPVVRAAMVPVVAAVPLVANSAVVRAKAAANVVKAGRVLVVLAKAVSRRAIKDLTLARFLTSPFIRTTPGSPRSQKRFAVPAARMSSLKSLA